MDKKNTFLGLVFIAAGIGFMFWQSQQIEKQRIEQLKQAETLQAPASQSTTPADAALLPANATSSPFDSQSSVSVSDLFQQVEVAECLLQFDQHFHHRSNAHTELAALLCNGLL